MLPSSVARSGSTARTSTDFGRGPAATGPSLTAGCAAVLDSVATFGCLRALIAATTTYATAPTAHSAATRATTRLRLRTNGCHLAAHDDGDGPEDRDGEHGGERDDRDVDAAEGPQRAEGDRAEQARRGDDRGQQSHAAGTQLLGQQRAGQRHHDAVGGRVEGPERGQVEDQRERRDRGDQQRAVD